MPEPLFRNIHREDQELNAAYNQAAESISKFVNFVQSETHEICMAKLRFRDPDLSEEIGKDQFFYLWLSNVYYHTNEKILSGVFFEIPDGFEKWHQIGQRLGFDPDDVFDWMVIDNGHMKGGFTIRVTRDRLENNEEKEKYDNYIGVSSYEPIEM